MSFEEGLFHYLDNHAGLSREVDDRIYPILLPQSPVLPAVTFQRIDTPRLLALERSLLPHPRFQFDCWAADTADRSGYAIAKDVAEQVRLALDVYSGAMGDYTVEVSLIDDEHDTYEPETKYWHSIVEAIIWYVE